MEELWNSCQPQIIVLDTPNKNNYYTLSINLFLGKIHFKNVLLDSSFYVKSMLARIKSHKWCVFDNWN